VSAHLAKSSARRKKYTQTHQKLPPSRAKFAARCGFRLGFSPLNFAPEFRHQIRPSGRDGLYMSQVTDLRENPQWQHANAQ
jgi:hypothetical protein